MDPCREYLDAMNACRTKASFFTAPSLTNSLPFSEIIKDVEKKYAVGSCVIPEQQKYDDCQAREKQKALNLKKK